MNAGNQVISSNNRETQQLPYTYHEWERLAQEKLDKGPFSFIEGNAGLGDTYKNNIEAFKKWKIRPRVLRNVQERDQSIELLGQTFKYPFLLAPVGVQRIMHPEGELASARAAAKMGIPFIASTATSFSMEEIAGVMGNAPRWYQLYWSNDNDITASLVKRAEKSGYSALVITVDAATVAWRVKDLENDYSPFKLGIGVSNYLTDPVFCSKLAKSPSEDMNAAIEYFFSVVTNPTITWENLNFIRENTKLPIILKGIVDPEDARLALEYGADGIVVSNHGGRQLDGSIGTLDALPGICEVIAGRIPVLLDSGIRSGTDIVKAVSLGANAVLIGRPFAYGLATAGKVGVEKVIQDLIKDTDYALALSGQTSIKDLDRSLLVDI